ncbi:hypothetical protein C5167_046598 [Papaver somniferum]|uniref:ATPase AAA-type core domain-containing protein n=1 Tax=Papaver somniferum TaxID=3469 RepID=A0A4Y7LI46_PAPSO|nr:hypothetical protein C5167_046598 [Papaver somniferum]
MNACLKLFWSVIVADIIGPLIHLLQNAEFDIKKEAAWAISNATSGGSHKHIKQLDVQGMKVKSWNNEPVAGQVVALILCHTRELAYQWFGDAEKLTKALFCFASKLPPLGARGGGSEHEATRIMRNEFMAAWDGLRSKDRQRIFVLGATNKPFDLDDVVMRCFPRRVLNPMKWRFLASVSVFITLLGADFMRMESFSKLEEFAETLVEDNREEHEEHGTQEEEAVGVDVDSIDGVILFNSNEAEEEWDTTNEGTLSS